MTVWAAIRKITSRPFCKRKHGKMESLLKTAWFIHSWKSAVAVISEAWGGSRPKYIFCDWVRVLERPQRSLFSNYLFISLQNKIHLLIFLSLTSCQSVTDCYIPYSLSMPTQQITKSFNGFNGHKIPSIIFIEILVFLMNSWTVSNLICEADKRLNKGQFIQWFICILAVLKCRVLQNNQQGKNINDVIYLRVAWYDMATIIRCSTLADVTCWWFKGLG